MNLTSEQSDALREVTNIGIGLAAGVLNEMLDSHVSLEVPFVRILSPVELQDELSENCQDKVFVVQLDFNGRFTGSADLIFPTESAANLVTILTGNELSTLDLDSIRIGTLTEVGNIVLNGVMGSIANVLKHHIDYSVPSYMENTVENLVKFISPDSKQNMILVKTRFAIQQFQIEGDILLIFEEGSFEMLLESIDAANAASGS